MSKHRNKTMLVTIKENNIVFKWPDDTISFVNSPPFIAINIDSAAIEKPNSVPQIPITTLIVSIPSSVFTSNDGFFLFTVTTTNEIIIITIGIIKERLLSSFWFLVIFFLIFNTLSLHRDKNLLFHYTYTQKQYIYSAFLCQLAMYAPIYPLTNL